MKHFGRSLLNPTPTSVLSTLATETSGERTSNATPFSSRRVDRSGDSIAGEGDFCLLSGNEQPVRNTSANKGRS